MMNARPTHERRPMLYNLAGGCEETWERGRPARIILAS